MMPNIIPNKSYVYLVTFILYFTRDVIDNIAFYFNNAIIIPNQNYWIEFEALLINETKEIVLIHKTFLKPYQFKFLGEELFNALVENYYANTKNNDKLKLLLKYKFID